MEDAEDKIFTGYLRRNMAKIVTKVKVREIMSHLPSLTQSDRETVEAKRENTGNYNAMQLLLLCLRRKDNWLEEFIFGLQSCQNNALASQIQEEYESMKVQRHGSVLAPMAPTSGGTLQPPLNPSTVATHEMDEDAALATPHHIESTSGDGILANHTGPSSAVVPSQSTPEPAASLQNHTTEDNGAVPSTILVTPTTHITSPAIPSPGPQVPLVKPVQETNPPEEKLHTASDNPTDSSMSTVGQVLAKDLHLSPVVTRPTEDAAGAMASLNVQDVTDGRASSSCGGGASADEEVCSNKPVLMTSVQVHQPFDSPSTFTPIAEEGAYSGDSVNLECSSNLSNHTSESVNAESIALSDAKSVALGDAKKTVPGDAESVVLSDAERVNTGDASSIALSDREKGAPGHAESVVLSDAERVFPGDAESVILSDTKRVAPGDAESVALSDAERVALGNAEGEALSDTKRVAPGDAESVALNSAESVAPGENENVALCEAERVAPGHAECVTFSEKEVVTPRDAEGVSSGEIANIIGNVEGFLPENKNTIVPSSEDGIVFGNNQSIAPDNRENVVRDNKGKVVTVNAKSLVGNNVETIVCDVLESSSLEAPESRAEKEHCDSAHHDITASIHNPESVIHDSSGPSNMQNTAADIVETTAPSNMESAACIDLETRNPSYAYLSQNVLKGNDCDIAHQEISSPDTLSTNHNSESLSPGEVDNGVPGEGDSGASSGRDSSAPSEEDSRTQVNSESGVLGNTDGGASVEEDNEATSEEDNGDTESESLGEEDNEASGDTDGGPPDGGDSGAPRDEDGGYPGEGGNWAPGETDSGSSGNGNSWASEKGDGGTPGEGDSGGPGERNNGAPGDGGNQAAEEDDSGEPQEEDNGESGQRDSGAPGQGDSMIPGKGESGGPGEGGNENSGEGESRETEVRNTGSPGEGESGGPDMGDSDRPGNTDSGAPDEVGIVVSSCTEPPQSNPEGNQDSNHIAVNFPSASMPNHVMKDVVPSNVEGATPNVVQSTTTGQPKNVVLSDIEPTHKELVENQSNSTELGISLHSSVLSNHSPETVGLNNREGGETEENNCSAIHLNISLSSAESFIPSTDSASPKNMGSRSPGNTSPAQDHCNSTDLTINLASPASLNHKPDNVANVDMESHAQKEMKNHYSAPCCDITVEQDVQKKELCMSEDLAVQNNTTSGETLVDVVTEKRLEAFPEQGQLNSQSPLGNYYVPAAVAGVVAAAVLWQLKK